MTVTTTVKRLSRRESAKSERRHRIIGAAREIIRETGDTDLSMRSLAERADVSVATAYNLFGSKRAVVLSVLEDERDFVERFESLEASDSIARIFAAHELAFSYYVGDPAFYRTLWRSLLSTSRDDDTGLATPERLERTRRIWLDLLNAAVDAGYLDPALPIDAILQPMAHATGGALLSWATGSLQTRYLTASVGITYAMLLQSCSTPLGDERIKSSRARYANLLSHQFAGSLHPLGDVL